jgi:hypothetical protein
MRNPFGRKPESMDELFDMMGLGSPQAEPTTNAGNDLASTPHNLTAMYQALATPHIFVPGDLVMWKDGLRNKVQPNYGQPAIVIEILGTPVFDQSETPSSPYFREPLTMICLLIDNDGDTLIYHYDARRFQPYVEATNDTAE